MARYLGAIEFDATPDNTETTTDTMPHSVDCSIKNTHTIFGKIIKQATDKSIQHTTVHVWCMCVCGMRIHICAYMTACIERDMAKERERRQAGLAGFEQLSKSMDLLRSSLRHQRSMDFQKLRSHKNYPFDRF